MKIGIEAQRLYRTKKHGMDIYALELIRHLQLIDHENEYVVFIKPDTDDSIIKETSNFKIVKPAAGFYPVWEQMALPLAAKNAGCDILHCTSNTAPVFSSIPLITTLHDIIYLENSYSQIMQGTGTPYQKFGNVYRRMIVPWIIKKCSKIITVSRYEKECIARFFKIDDDSRLNMVYNGVGEHFKPVTDQSELHRIKTKYHLPAQFFFFLGNTDPKKNTKGALKAFSDFLKQTGKDYHLVMVDFDLYELEQLLDEIEDPGLVNRIILTGYVVNTDLPAIYSQCEVFLYPSLRESFGIPMLEAMACGVPVITSNTSSMPEVAGGAALLVDPFNPEEITDALIRYISDNVLRSKMIEKGIEQAAKFSWKTMARHVLDVYRQVEANTA